MRRRPAASAPEGATPMRRRPAESAPEAATPMRRRPTESALEGPRASRQGHLRRPSARGWSPRPPRPCPPARARAAWRRRSARGGRRAGRRRWRRGRPRRRPCHRCAFACAGRPGFASADRRRPPCDRCRGRWQSAPTGPWRRAGRRACAGAPPHAASTGASCRSASARASASRRTTRPARRARRPDPPRRRGVRRRGQPLLVSRSSPGWSDRAPPGRASFATCLRG